MQEEKIKKRVFIAIDNGVSGSIGMIHDDGTYTFCKTPVKKELNYTKAKSFINRIDGIKLKELLSVSGPGSYVMIERPLVNPKMFQASVSALRAYEATVVVLEDLRLPYETIDSKQWQRVLLPAGIKGPELKVASRQVGNRMFPEVKDVKHDDCDGILMAEFCRRSKK